MKKRLFYLVYYIRETDWSKFSLFLRHAKTETNRNSVSIVIELLRDVFRYNISLLDYFYFRFYTKNASQKAEYAGTGFMYEYQLQMNPVTTRNVLADKIKFLSRYRQFINRNFLAIDTLHQHPERYQTLLNESGKLVVKGSKGQVGAEVEVIKQQDFNSGKALLAYMQSKNFDLAEAFVIQHPALNELSPSGLNTVRIITQLVNQQVIILGARLRITINSSVDNMAAGNPAASINIDTGRVEGKAVFSDIRKEAIDVHPVTSTTITGFEIPFWQEVKDVINQAALLVPDNKSIGWDVAITSQGPQLIEGNHNWCKLLWQLPVNKGLKRELETFLNE